MSSSETAAIVLAAGRGTRLRSALPKVLHEIADRPMIAHVLAAARMLGPSRLVVVVAPGDERVSRAVAPAPTVIQDPPLGTGHAVAQALPHLDGFSGGVLVLFGDTPLVRGETLARLRAALEAPGVAVAVLGFRPADTAEYGRLLLDGDGTLRAIVEHRDADAAERATGLCNAGVMALAGRPLADLVRAIGNRNAKGEYYLTDVVALARAQGLKAVVVEAAAEEVQGVNDRVELAAAEAAMQARLRKEAMLAGVTFQDPASVRLSADTRFGRDVTVGPHVVFGPGARIGDGVAIRAFSHVEGAIVEAGAVIGPFARLRPGTLVGPHAHVGNFVELKNAVLGAGAKANHLTYLGDAEVGADSNIGAGTITCNYDGFSKHRTVIGEGAFIGSNTALVAPVTVGDGAMVGAGSTVVRDVGADALVTTRAPTVEKPGWAARWRALKSRRKPE